MNHSKKEKKKNKTKKLTENFLKNNQKLLIVGGTIITVIIIISMILFIQPSPEEDSAIKMMEEYYSIINSTGLDDELQNNLNLLEISTGPAKAYFESEKNKTELIKLKLDNADEKFIEECNKIGDSQKCIEQKKIFDENIATINNEFAVNYVPLKINVLDINSTNATVKVERIVSTIYGEETSIANYYLIKQDEMWKIYNLSINGEYPTINESNQEDLNLFENELKILKEDLIYSICNPIECSKNNQSFCEDTIKININYSCFEGECISEETKDINNFDCNYWVPCNNCESKSNTKCDGTTLINENFYCDQKEGCKSKVSKQEKNEGCGYRDPAKYYYTEFNKVLTKTEKYDYDTKLKVELVKVGERFLGDTKDIRVYWEIENVGIKDLLSLHPHQSTIIIADKKQYDSDLFDMDNLNDDFKIGNSTGGSLKVGVKASGGVVIRDIPYGENKLRIILEKVMFGDFEFTVDLKSKQVTTTNTSNNSTSTLTSNSYTNTNSIDNTPSNNVYCGLYEIEKDGVCVDCGGKNEIPCTNNTCQYGFTLENSVCVKSCGFMKIKYNGSCIDCGGIGEVCCENDYCLTGDCGDNGKCKTSCGGHLEFCCSGRTCEQPGDYCSENNLCLSCGDPGAQCCSGNTCNSDLQFCSNNVCETKGSVIGGPCLEDMCFTGECVNETCQ